MVTWHGRIQSNETTNITTTGCIHNSAPNEHSRQGTNVWIDAHHSSGCHSHHATTGTRCSDLGTSTATGECHWTYRPAAATTEWHIPVIIQFVAQCRGNHFFGWYQYVRDNVTVVVVLLRSHITKIWNTSTFEAMHRFLSIDFIQCDGGTHRTRTTFGITRYLGGKAYVT